MVQELANYDNFASMFQTSRPNMNAYSGGGMHLPAFYGGSQVQPGQYTHDYGQYGDGIGSNIPPQSGTPSPTSWSAAAASMYHQQTAATAGSRHTPPTLEDWSQNSPFTGHNSALSVAVSQNGASTYSYRPSAMHAAQFSNMPQDLGHYVQSTPNSMIPPSSQSPSPNSGSSHHGGGVGSSPISRQSRGPYEWMKRQPFQGGPPTGKTRTKDKYRIVYSEYQKVELEKEYLYSKYITIQRKAELARSIGLSERQVKIWFQNRRAKERKQKRKREDAIASVHSPGDDDHTKDIEPIKVEPSQDYIPTVNPQGHMHHHHLSSPV